MLAPPIGGEGSGKTIIKSPRTTPPPHGTDYSVLPKILQKPGS